VYICNNCGALFETPVQYTETHGLDSPPYETWNGCPECLGSYAKTFECDVCNEYILGKYILVSNGMKICEECFTTNNIVEE
jgi:hypothetical protein